MRAAIGRHTAVCAISSARRVRRRVSRSSTANLRDDFFPAHGYIPQIQALIALVVVIDNSVS